MTKICLPFNFFETDAISHIQVERKITYKTIIINSVNVLLLGDQETKAPAAPILKGDATGFWTQNSVDIVPIVEVIVKAIWDFNNLSRITILNYDQMVWLKKWPPHLQKIQTPNCWDHNIQLILQWH